MYINCTQLSIALNIFCDVVKCDAAVSCVTLEIIKCTKNCTALIVIALAVGSGYIGCRDSETR